MTALSEFVDLDLSGWGSHKNVTHQVVRELVIPKEITFPLRAKYDYVNRTLAGLEGSRLRQMIPT